jgi:hypothetical protein
VADHLDHRRQFFGERDGEKKEEERKKKARPNWFRRQGASLVGALQCPKGASEAGTLLVYVVHPLSIWMGVRIDGALYLGPYMK